MNDYARSTHSTKHRLVAAWGPVAVWLVLIFALSSIPALGSGTSDEFRLDARSFAHVAIYMGLGFVVLRACLMLDVTRAGWWTVVFGLLNAVGDEIHQVFVPGRTPSLVDIALDGIGICVGALAWRQFALRRPKLFAREGSDEHGHTVR